MLDLEHRTFQVERDPRVHALPRELELKLFTAQSDIVERARRRDPLLSRRRLERRPRHAGRRRAQVRRRRRLADRPRRDSGLIERCRTMNRRLRIAQRSLTRLLAARSAGRLRDPGARRHGAVPALLGRARQCRGRRRLQPRGAGRRERARRGRVRAAAARRRRRRGTADDGHIEWTAQVAPYSSPGVNPDTERGSDAMPLRLLRVSVDVTFPAPSGGKRTLTLATTRIGPKETR